MTARIMIIDDEAPIRDMVRFALELSHFEVIEAETAKEGQRKIIEKTPDLLLLDWMLPDQAGIELAQTLKVQYPALPIIMLTARAEEESRVLGLEQADDYVIKPFSPRELIARIKAVLRRSQTHAGESTEPAQFISLGSLCVNQDSQQVFINDQAVKTGPIEYKLICFFITHPNKVFSREQLLNRVWGPQVYVSERTVDVHIRRLRKILESAGSYNYIHTTRGSGYSLRLPAEDDSA
ncbi:winged helix-turn-helix domain-containing protein [Piscirickettsia salmonis]|uniref:winged helix-turn-helix domain-containing protein n=1 Tax=Piscirickettsia salmonis TaxID=1238 RepID=UPI0007C87EC8|nr:Phosphate regulon transcriptional regulatory protein PhoB [Piscirickettsiaceae bacterium NZ-RLO1]